MAKKKNSMHITFYGGHEVSELDFELYDEVGLDDENRGYDIVVLKDETYNLESYPIKKDRLIKLLQETKGEYVEIAADIQHHGYYFNTMDIRLSTDEEIKADDAKRKKRERKEKLDAYNELKKQLAKLEKELQIKK